MSKVKIQKKLNRCFILKRELRENEGEENSLVRTFSFASDEPYERWWGIEILSMKKGDMDMSRLQNSAPLLFNHDWDKHIGVVQKAWMENGKAYCEVKFSSNDFAQEKMRDLDDSILVNVSFGYQINKMEKQGETNGVPEYLVTDYQPYEISLVTVPADNTVGVGRSADNQDGEIEVTISEKVAETTPIVEEKKDTVKVEIKEQKTFSKGEKMDELEKMKNENQIRKIASEHNAPADMVRKYIDEGKTALEFTQDLARQLGGEVQMLKGSALKLSDKEQKSYSIVRAITAATTNDWSKAGFEREVSDELEKRNTKRSQGSSFFIPTNVRAAYAAGADATGGFLVENDRSMDIISALVSKLVLKRAGAKVLTGLKGGIQIPKSAGGTTMYWVAESGAITQSESTIGQVALNPKTAGVYSEFSKQLLIQSSHDVEAFVRGELENAMAQGLDIAGLRGSGASNQPKGVLNYAGIGSVVGGTNGATITEAHIIDLETAISAANAESNDLVYITTGKLVGAIKKLRDTASGQKVFDTNIKGTREGSIGVLNGLDLFRTNNLISNGTKGTGTNLSQIICGDFTQMVIGQWGDGIEIEVNPYADFKAGKLGIRAMLFSDINLRHEQAFAGSSDLF